MKKNIFLPVIILMTGIILLDTVSPSFAQENKIDSLFSVLKQLNKTPDTSKVNTLNALANEFRSNDPDTAIYFANEALALATKINYKIGIANAYLCFGMPLINLGKYEEALKNLNDALKLYDQLLSSGKTADKSKILKQKAKAFHNIGIIYWHQGNYPEALKNYFASLKIREEIGDKNGIFASYNNIGIIYGLQGNYPDALKNHFAALKIREEIGDKNGISASYNNIGIIYEKQSNYPEALKNYFASLKIQEEIGDKQGIAQSYNGIGNIYNLQDNYPEALKNYFAALKISEEIGDKIVIAASYNNIGTIYYRQGNYPEAVKNFFASLKINEEIGNKQGIAYSYNNIGEIYREQGNNPEALKNYFAALKINEEIGDKQGIAYSYNNIGNIYTKQKKNSEAAQYLNKGLSLAKEIASLDDIKESYDGLATLDSAQGNFKQSLMHYKMYITYRDSLFNEENTKKLVQSQMQYEFDKKESATKADQDKKDILSVAQIKRQTLIKNTTLGGVGIAGIFVFLSVRAFNRRKKISFEKSVSEVEMKALRSQMNPHFISNSLQSINKYILVNEKENASEYLSRFSKLMRLILENSREQEITIEKDLHALDLYLQLESLRFNNKFDYKIEVSEDVNPENTLIPPLLLQPFVENSILHGVRSIDNGHIFIKVNKQDNMIRCTVEDNGVGREESVTIETGEQKKRESLGMKITLERLAVINQLKKVKAAINVFDLKNNNNISEGLRVELMLPFENAF